MMELRVSDKIIYFAKYRIAVTLTGAERASFEWPYAGGIYAESDQGKTDIESRLTTLGKSFATTDISPTQAQIDKKAEIDGSVTGRSEALAEM